MSAFVKLYIKIDKNNKQCDICVCMGGSYLCSPHGRCTLWQSWALMCSPADTDWSDCSRTPDLWARTNIYFHLSPVWWNITEHSRWSHVHRAAVRVPLMYPLSRTAWYVGRRVRNFLSFILVFFWSDESMLTEFFIAVGRQAPCECISFANTLNVHSVAQGHSQTYLGSS